MTLHLLFILKISVDLFGSLSPTLSAQPSFKNARSSEFHLGRDVRAPQRKYMIAEGNSGIRRQIMSPGL